MTPIQQRPWWLAQVAVPICFTFFGAFLGFGFGRLKDWLDDRKAKKAFLKAIRIELSTIRDHLAGTLKDTTANRELLAQGQRQALHLATAFLTTIYSSQFAKLKDPSDPLVIEIVRFHGDLSNLERVKSHLTAASFDLALLPGGGQNAGREASIAALYVSSLDEVINRIGKLLPAADSLIAKLPM